MKGEALRGRKHRKSDASPPCLSFLRSNKVVVKMARLAAVVLIVFSLTFLSSSPAGLASSVSSRGSMLLKRKVLGSRPPSCMSKCSSCSPCMATLVAFPRERSFSALRHEEDDGYYLLAWKCRCGNKLYQP
ncbi:hypothetical protein MUK42_26685 [Musa troglodytarum]|uniref:Epidermal patterning factor-like protein n=2 Tax=Musa troglodytarum TaxID=320322 RepID=A0A9E7JRU9_9LILI|nr:hypothetical protein MUK42_26685 [Musa troglodytarum]